MLKGFLYVDLSYCQGLIIQSFLISSHTDGATSFDELCEARSQSFPVWPDVEIKSSPSFSKSCPKMSNASLYLRIILFTLAQKVTINFVDFKKKIRLQDFSKIAQSGYNGHYLPIICSVRTHTTFTSAHPPTHTLTHTPSHTHIHLFY